MSLPLVLTPDAEADLAEIRTWYDGQRTGLGGRWILSLEATLGRILFAPLSAAEVSRGVRRAAVRRFPYGVFYRVDTHQIAVIAVYHDRRHPRGWQARV